MKPPHNQSGSKTFDRYSLYLLVPSPEIGCGFMVQRGGDPLFFIETASIGVQGQTNRDSPGKPLSERTLLHGNQARACSCAVFPSDHDCVLSSFQAVGYYNVDLVHSRETWGESRKKNLRGS